MDLLGLLGHPHILLLRADGPGPSVRGLKEQSRAARYFPGLQVGKALAESGTFFFPDVFGGFTG